MSSKEISLEEADTLLKADKDGWVLRPYPIEGVSKKEFASVLKEARHYLWHDEWQSAMEAARELSDVGGVMYVLIYRVKVKVSINSHWVEGKQKTK